MKFIDLFCGIGGFRLALERSKGDCVFSSDIDKFACQTYKDNFGDFPLSDITKIKTSDIPNFDILCAGFPCQPFSIAGKRKGFGDTRGTLFFDIERIIRDKKPKCFILENVKGLTNHNNGKTFDTIKNILAKRVNGQPNTTKLKNNLGYNIYYKVLNSKDYGVPQNRERIYIIGFLNQEICFEFPVPKKESTNLSNILEKNVKDHNISEIAKNNIKNNLEKHPKYKQIYKNKNLIAYEIRKSKCSFRYDNLSPTLTAKMGTGGNNVPVIVRKMRKLTTKECLRIQGFPEDFKIKNNSSQSYKQIGNSVSVPLIEAITKKIIKYL
jgi:DNA (cytosine-5)-methyltransferase 1